MKRLKLGINEKKVIQAIGLGILVLVALSSPSPKLPRVLIPLIRRRGQKEFKKLLRQLKTKRVIYLSGEKIKLTNRGRKLLDEIYLSEFKITKSQKWDGLWRLISYDVPEIYKNSRNTFRKVLENNGFQQIHKSLWVSPYDCKEEIAVFCKNLNMTKDVIVMTTDHLPNQKDMIEHFNLKATH